MYKKIKIENFRGITNLELNDLRQFNLLVGKNNCGKTSLLESIFLLCGPTNINLPIIVNSFRGIHLRNDYPWPIFFYNLDFRTPIRLYGEMTQSKEKRTLIIGM